MLTRRDFLNRTLAAAPLLCVPPARAADASTRLGVCTYSYQQHWTAAKKDQPNLLFRDALGFLDHCHRFGASGVQIVLGPWEAGYAAKVRAKAEALGMYVEGQVVMPQADDDVARFDSQLRTARDAGMDIVRAVCLSGRRYETLATEADWARFVDRSRAAVTRSEPVVRKHRLKLAIENHKDWRVDEMIDLLKRVGSEFVGVCLDTGNSIALLEEPHTVVEALAPLAFTTHFKDMAAEEAPDGFRLAEVPLGDGYLDLMKIVGTLRRVNPAIRFNLEMITRDPLSVPCLIDKYWGTMKGVPGLDLARTLRTARARKQALPRISGLSQPEVLRREEDNVLRSFTFARRRLD